MVMKIYLALGIAHACAYPIGYYCFMHYAVGW